MDKALATKVTTIYIYIFLVFKCLPLKQFLSSKSPILEGFFYSSLVVALVASTLSILSSSASSLLVALPWSPLLLHSPPLQHYYSD